MRHMLLHCESAWGFNKLLPDGDLRGFLDHPLGRQRRAVHNNLACGNKWSVHVVTVNDDLHTRCVITSGAVSKLLPSDTPAITPVSGWSYCKQGGASKLSCDYNLHL
jgi:hypothetical protein